MKDFKALVALSLLGFVVCSCSPTKSSLTTRASIPASRVNEESASAYSRYIVPPVVRSDRVKRVLHHLLFS